MDETYRTSLFQASLKLAGLKDARSFGRSVTTGSLQGYFDEVYGNRESNFRAEEFVIPKDERANGQILS
jgi:hypothetical protein